MKRQLKLSAIAASVLLALGGHTAAFAAQMSDAQIRAMVESIVNERTADLKKEVRGLRHQVGYLKQELATSKSIHYRNGRKGQRSRYLAEGEQSTGEAIEGEQYPGEPREGLVNQGDSNFYQLPTRIHRNAMARSAKSSPLTPIFVAGTPVVSSPYIGVRSAYDGSDLLVNESKVNLDVRLLKQRQALHDSLIRAGIPLPNHPIIELSGELEGQGTSIKTYPGDTEADIDLTDAELDTYIRLNHCVQGFMDVAYDNSKTVPTRVSNSRVFLNQGFVTIGNLSHEPYYVTFGQYYMPFGQYSSYEITDSLAKMLGRTKKRGLTFGLYPHEATGFYGATYVFKSDTEDSDKTVAGGVNLGVKEKIGGLTAEIAGGYISTLADSGGMQSTGAPSNIQFQGFGTNNETEELEHAVPGANVHGSLSYSNYTLIGEYVTATRDFAMQDLSFNDHGAKPTAGRIEGVYSFMLHDRPGSLALGYGWTTEALGLSLPKERYNATINYAFWHSTLESLEFRHDKNYGVDDTASGGHFIQVFGPQNKYVEQVTLQMDVYF